MPKVVKVPEKKPDYFKMRVYDPTTGSVDKSYKDMNQLRKFEEYYRKKGITTLRNV